MPALEVTAGNGLRHGTGNPGCASPIREKNAKGAMPLWTPITLDLPVLSFDGVARFIRFALIARVAVSVVWRAVTWRAGLAIDSLANLLEGRLELLDG